MKLLEIVQNLDQFDDDLTIYAAKPWTTSSEAIVTAEPEVSGLPPEAEASGLSYFLEVFVAMEFLEDWQHGDKGGSASERDACARLITYATNDC